MDVTAEGALDCVALGINPGGASGHTPLRARLGEEQGSQDPRGPERGLCLQDGRV